MNRSKKVERTRPESPNTDTADSQDAAALGGLSGREASGDEVSSSDVVYPGGRRRSDVTDVQDDGAGDTPDGLGPLEEAIRHGAEDIPSSSSRKSAEGIPVFDRGDLPPKV